MAENLPALVQLREEWRPVAGYEGRYEVSSLGRVRSWINRGGSRRTEATIMVPVPNGDRGQYRKVVLSRSSRVQNKLIHRLVLEAFVGPCPAGHEDAHDDGNGSHNALSNLAWKTKVDNNADKLRHGTQTRGEQHPRSKLTEWQVLEIRAAEAGVDPRDLGKKYGIAGITVNAIRNRMTWRHI